MPLNEAAEPIFPAVHETLDRDIELPLPEESAAVEPEPSSKAQWATRPEVGAATWANWVAGEIEETDGLPLSLVKAKMAAPAAATNSMTAKKMLDENPPCCCMIIFVIRLPLISLL